MSCNCPPNIYIINGEICTIILFNRKGKKVAETIIDSEDKEKCSPYTWTAFKSKEEVRALSRVGMLSLFLLNIKPSSKIVGDHIDGNTLNNRKQNLQVITQQQNVMKRGMFKSNTSGYRGVCQFSRDDRWRASIGFNGKTIHIGLYPTKEEAAVAYNGEAQKLFGRFAVLNNILGEA